LYWLPNAVDVDAYRQQTDKTFGRCVGYIGRLVSWKGIDTFIRVAELVWKMNCKTRFIVVGGGPLLQVYRDSSVSEYVEFLGEQSSKAVLRILDSIDILVLPSYHENVPTVALEAMAKGIPVVASDVGAVSEVVIHENNGYLVRAGDTKSFAEYVRYLLENPSIRDKLGENGRTLVNEYYTFHKVAERAENLYREILGRNEQLF